MMIGKVNVQMNTCGTPNLTQGNNCRCPRKHGMRIDGWIQLKYGIVLGRVQQHVQEPGSDRES